MDIAIFVPFVFLIFLLIGAKLVWMSGFVNGTMLETQSWLDALDKIRVPNWQSLPAAGNDNKNLTPEQIEYMNRVYVSAYALALKDIQREIADQRREALEKIKAQEPKEPRW